MGVWKVIFHIAAPIIIATVVIILVPGIPPTDIEPIAFEVLSPRKVVEGWFAENTILDEAEVYYVNPNGSTEALAVQDDDTVFTGDQTGTILKITGKQKAEHIGRLRYPCSVGVGTNSRLEQSGGSKPVLCGWPLGMRLDEERNLLTMDHFGGLTKIDVKTGNYENLIPKSRPIEGKIGHVPEDLAIGKDGSIYWTDGSTIGNFFDEMIANPSGRLMKFDPKHRTSKVILENLWFSNGVCLSDDEQFVIVADTGRSRILRYYLKGDKAGQSDTFVDGLPGYPDNIRSNGRGGFYVPLAAPWNDKFSMKLHLLSSRPMLRKLIIKSRYLLLKLMSYFKEYLPESLYLDWIENYILHNEPILGLSKMPRTATVVELSKSGKIIGILNGKSGKVTGLSHMEVGKEYAFFTSPFEGKVWRIRLDILRRMH